MQASQFPNVLLMQLSQLFPASGAKEINYIANVLISQNQAQSIPQTNTLGMTCLADCMQYQAKTGESFFGFSSPCSQVTATNCQTHYTASEISTSPSMVPTTVEETTELPEDDNMFAFINAFDEIPLNQSLEGEHQENLLNGSRKIMKEKIQSRKTKNQKSRSRKNLWTEEEDAQLKELVAKHGTLWARIGSIMGGKSGKQVRDRYTNMLRPDINHAKWTVEEDQLFVKLLEKYGNKWCQIAAEMPGRTESQVKSKFYCLKRNKKDDDQRKKTLKKAIEVVEKRKTLTLLTESSPAYSTTTLEQTPVCYKNIDMYFGFNEAQEASTLLEQCQKNKFAFEGDCLLSEKSIQFEEEGLHLEGAQVNQSSILSRQNSSDDDIDCFFEFKNEERIPPRHFPTSFDLYN